MKKPTSKPTTRAQRPSSRKAAAVARAKGPWVRRHPVLALGTVAAGVGAYALLRRKGAKKSTSKQRKAGAPAARRGR